MKILIITNKFLNAMVSGYDLRVWPLCQALATAGHRLQLFVVPINPGRATDDSNLISDISSVFEVVDCAPSPNNARPSLRRHLRLSESNYYKQANPEFHKDVCARLAGACQRFAPDRVIYFGTNLIGFKGCDEAIPHLIDVCDSVHLTLDRQYAASPVGFGREALRRKVQMSRWRMAEGSLARHFRRISAISPADATRLSELNSQIPVEVIPNGVNEALLRAHIRPAPTRRGVVFWGNLGFQPNAEALRFFYENVHRPHLASLGVEFAVIGSNAPDWLQAKAVLDPSLRLLGFVPDLTDVVSDYPVMVAPLISGSGLKNKVLEAFALGLPVVGTPMAAEAIPEAIKGQHYMGGASPDQLAHAIRRLLDDLPARTRLSEAARSLVEVHYSWNSVGRKWCRWVEMQ